MGLLQKAINVCNSPYLIKILQLRYGFLKSHLMSTERPKKGEQRNKVQDYRDECLRVKVKRRFSLAKRKCGIGFVMAKPEDTAAHVVAISVPVLNLKKIRCDFFALLEWLLGRCLAFYSPSKKWRDVQ